MPFKVNGFITHSKPLAIAAIASNRILTFYETGLDDAQQLMLQNPSYYSELVGYSEPEGLALTMLFWAIRHNDEAIALTLL